MFKRSLKRRDSAASLNKKHSRVASSIPAAPSRTLIMSATPSSNNSACTSMVSAPPRRHYHVHSYAGMSLEPTLEEPLSSPDELLAFEDEPLFDDTFLSSEPSDYYFDSFLAPPTLQAHRLHSMTSSSYLQKPSALQDVEVVDNESILSREDYTSRVASSIYADDDVATAVYIARPMQKPRMVDVSPPASVTRRSSMAPSDASARDYGSASHSRSSSYFARNSYSGTSSLSNSSDSEDDFTKGNASPVTPASTVDDSDAKSDTKYIAFESDAPMVSIAKVSHIRNFSCPTPRMIRENSATRQARTEKEQVPGGTNSLPSSPAASGSKRFPVEQVPKRAASIDSRQRPAIALRRSSAIVR